MVLNWLAVSLKLPKIKFFCCACPGKPEQALFYMSLKEDCFLQPCKTHQILTKTGVLEGTTHRFLLAAKNTSHIIKIEPYEKQQ